jgi:hypothetical protein
MTPRTDRAAFVLQRAGVNLVHADEARELETDLREARELLRSALIYDEHGSGHLHIDLANMYRDFLSRMEAKDK